MDTSHASESKDRGWYYKVGMLVENLDEIKTEFGNNLNSMHRADSVEKEEFIGDLDRQLADFVDLYDEELDALGMTVVTEARELLFPSEDLIDDDDDQSAAVQPVRFFSFALENGKKFTQFLAAQKELFYEKKFEVLEAFLRDVYYDCLHAAHESRSKDMFTQQALDTARSLAGVLQKHYNPEQDALVRSYAEKFTRIADAKEGDYIELIDYTERAYENLLFSTASDYKTFFKIRREAVYMQQADHDTSEEEIVEILRMGAVVQPLESVVDFLTVATGYALVSAHVVETSKRAAALIDGYADAVNEEIGTSADRVRFLRTLADAKDAIMQWLMAYKTTHLDTFVESDQGIETLRKLDTVIGTLSS